MMEVAHMLQTYGPWGFVVVLLGAVGRLWVAYIHSRDKNEATLQEQVKSAIGFVTETTTASVELRAALEQVLAALQAIERRLENVEKRR